MGAVREDEGNTIVEEQQVGSFRPRITVITVHLDRPSRLEKTLISVGGQTYPRTNLEHLVVDGGSGERSLEVLHRFADRLAWWVSEKDDGLFDAMNKALRRATGDWIYFLNAGDTYVRPTTLEEVAVSLPAPGGLVYGDVLLRRRNGFVKRWPQPPALMRWGLFRNVCHQAVFYSRAALRGKTFDTHYRFSADADLHLRFAGELEPQSIRRIDVPVAVYEQEGLSFREGWRALEERGRQIRRRLIGWRRPLNLANLARQRVKYRLRTRRRDRIPRLLVLSLRRRGGALLYAREIVDRFQIPLDVFVSSYAEEAGPRGAQAAPTYGSLAGFLLATAWRLPRLLGRFALGLISRRYAALYLPSFHSWNPAFIALFRLFGVRSIVTEHDGLPLPGEAWPFEGLARSLCLRMASRSIYLSEFVRDRILQGGGRLGTTFVEPLGVLAHGGLWEPAREHPERALRVLFLGRVTSRKGVDLLIDALDRLPDDVVAGMTIAGESLDRRDLRTTDARVRWIPRWLADEEIAELVRDHDVLALPYRHASQSGVVTIGIAGAIPMICTRAGALEEQLAGDEALFVDTTAEAIAEGLRKLFDDTECYRGMSQALCERRRRSSWSEIAGRIEGIVTWVDCGGIEEPWTASESE